MRGIGKNIVAGVDIVLFGIGVGPGASDLLTLRAVRILRTIDIVLAPRREGNDASKAYAIASEYLPKGCEIVSLDFPMTRDIDDLERAWRAAAKKTLSLVRTGKNVAFLTLGDPLVYSTFSYLLRAIKQEDATLEVCIIPGIPSYQAASAKIGLPLCCGEEHLRILSGIVSKEELVAQLTGADTVVIMKCYRNFAAICDALRETGRDNDVWQVRYAEQEGCSFTQGLPLEKPPYMTLLLSFRPR